ncbi:regulator [Enterobacter sp. BNK-8]|uniref:regulator n=1 Tax=Enterobacter sp. BNK-8 TaxID=3376145 RepID=UPI003B502260
MTPNISITLNTPHVTIERYNELTGLPVDTINDMLAGGRLPRHRLRKDKKLERVMINMAALTVNALSACKTFTCCFHFYGSILR